jgi:hypothetical protein
MSLNKFGRLVAPADARDLNYPIRAAMHQIHALGAKPTPRKRDYVDGPLLDQGNAPQCVGYSTRDFINGAPIVTKVGVGPSATEIYKGAQGLDEWPGSNYDGTSVRGAMKYLQEQKLISSYVWGQTVDAAIEWMNGGYGTVLVGTNWYAEMSDVDANGFMREPAPSMSTPIGGHAWRWKWYDAKKKGILMRQTWGHDYGFKRAGQLSGYAYLRIDFARRLLREDGEIAAPTQVKIEPLKVA